LEANERQVKHSIWLRLIPLLNGIIPIILISTTYLYFLIAYNTAGGSSAIGYFIYGWTELLILSTFVSIVPGVASWFLYGLEFVGSEFTAFLLINILILIGGIACTVSGFAYSSDKPQRNRILLLLGGILTFPLGILSFMAIFMTRSKSEESEHISLKTRFVTEFRKNKLPYILIIPFIIFLLFSYLIPILRGLYITFFSYPLDDLSRAFIPVDYSQDPLLWTIHALLGGLQNQDPIFVGIDNLLELFSHTSRAGSFQKALNNNIFFVIIFVPSVIAFSLFLAVVLNNKFLKGEDAYTTIFYMPVITSILVVSVIWLRVIFDPDSGVLTLLMQILTPIVDLFFIILNIITLGLIPANSVADNIDWLSQYLMESIAGMTIWRRVGFDVLILLAGLKSIPKSLYEAAEIDGHGAWSKFKNITIPMLKGPLGVVIVLELINGWLVFQELYGLNVAGSDNTLAIYLVYNYADPRIMTFASTVGYFIFAMSAFLTLIDRTRVRGILKAYVITCLLAILFSIPSNRANTDPKGLGLTVEWLTYDIFFMAISFFILTYYLIFIVIKNRDIEQDLIGLRNIGVFTLFTSILYLLNGYNSYSQSDFGVTEFAIGIFPYIPILMLGALPLFIGLFLLLLNRYPSVKEKTKLIFSLTWGFSILIAFSLISLEIISSFIRFAELHTGEELTFYLDLLLVANGVLRGTNTILVGSAFIWIIIALLVIRGLYRSTTHFATLSLILGIIVMFIGLLPTLFTLFSIVLSSYLIGVILVIIGLMMVFAHIYVPIVKSSDDSHSIIAFGSLVLIFANIGWFLFVPFSAIASHELVSIIFVGLTMFIDIIGFAIFGLGILKARNENQLAVKVSGFCYLGWALFTFIWRILSPILFIPQVGYLSLDLGLITSNMALIMLNNIIIIILFILNGILLVIGTLLTEKIYEGSPRFLLPYSIVNLFGILMISLPLFIGVELGTMNIFFISMEIGLLIKIIVVPIIGILLFWSFFNQIRKIPSSFSLEDKSSNIQGSVTL